MALNYCRIIRVVMILAAIGCLTAITPVAYGQTDRLPDGQSEPLAVIEALDASLNAKDLDAALVLWADDAEVRQTPPQPGSTGVYRGKAEVQSFLESMLAQNVQFELAETRQVDGDQVTWTNNTSVDGWRRLGIAPLQGQAVATVHDGKIVTFSVALTPASMDKLQQAIGNMPKMPTTGAGGSAESTTNSRWLPTHLLIAFVSLVVAGLTGLLGGQRRIGRLR